MKIIGLTGGICAGKSVVCRVFEQHFQIPLIDADIIARNLLGGSLQETPTEILLQIKKIFGHVVFTPQGQLNRARLREQVFACDTQRKQLENLLHPRVYLEIDRQITALKKHAAAPYLLVCIPLLFETADHGQFDRIVLVSCDEDIRIQRCCQRDHCDTALIKKMMAAQMPEEQKRQLADDLIDNNGDLSDLLPQITILHKKYVTTHPPNKLM